MAKKSGLYYVEEDVGRVIKKATGKNPSKGVIWTIVVLTAFALGAIYVSFIYVGVEKTKIVDCGDDMDCFIGAAEKCLPAEVMFTKVKETEIDVIKEGVVMRLEGMDSNGKCIYYERLESTKIDFTDARTLQLKNNGLSDEQIEKRIFTSNNRVQKGVGQYYTCLFEVEDLAVILENWKEGNFASSDYDIAECVVN
jgi:hypothetical protein